jgi:hypothetical protein
MGHRTIANYALNRLGKNGLIPAPLFSLVLERESKCMIKDTGIWEVFGRADSLRDRVATVSEEIEIKKMRKKS